jgi:GT2 family glycosyltransferase
MYNRDQSVIDVVDQVFFPSLLQNGSQDTELIIIDDASVLEKETTRVVAKYLPELRARFGHVTMKRNVTNLGFAGSYNTGIKIASGSKLVITNDDVYFPRGSVDALLQTLNEAQYLIAGPVTNAKTAWSYQYCKQAPTLRSYSHLELTRLEEFATVLRKRMLNHRMETDNLCGFCFAADAAFLKEMGGFDEHFKYGFFEDTDLIQRTVARHGLDTVVINCEVFVAHGGVKGSSGSMNQQPLKMVKSLMVNQYKYAQRWGWGTLAKRLRYGITSQMTGSGTISDDF